jgi:hypothetical protein
MKVLVTILPFFLATTVYCAPNVPPREHSTKGKINLVNAGPYNGDSAYFKCDDPSFGCLSSQFQDCINVSGTNYCVKITI